MEITTSACAIYECHSCDYRKSGACSGCLAGNVQLIEQGREPCAVYACVEASGLTSCASCEEPACVLRRSAESICPLRGRFEKKRWWAGHISRALEGRVRSQADGEKISEKVINRLRWYLTALEYYKSEGCESVSSWQLAEKVGVNSSLIRKDLSRFGDFGTPSFGYRTDYLIDRLKSILRLDRSRGIIWIGACAFRQMAAVVSRMEGHGCKVFGVFDPDPGEIGGAIREQPVRPLGDLRDFLANNSVHAAVLVIPGGQAQSIASLLDEMGVRAILNLSGELVVLPDRVRVTSIDLAGELMELCYYCE